MINLTIKLTVDELEKLREQKGETVEECIRGFVSSCQPGGSGWVHPAVAAAKHEEGGP